MADDKKAKKDDKEKDKDKAADTEGDVAEGVEGGEGTSKFNAKKVVLFGVLPLLLLVGGGAGAYFTGMLDKFLPGKHLDCENVKEDSENFEACLAQLSGKNMATPGAFLEIPDMIVNLNSNSKQPRFLKISLKLELATAEDSKKMEQMLPRIVDQFQTYLRELRIEDLRGTSGVYRMKIELLNRVRAAAPEVVVNDVLFQEILVQ